GEKIHASVRKELLSESSVVSKIEPINDCNYICLTNLCWIIRGLSCPNLCGALVGVGGTDDTEDEELAEIFDSAHKISSTLNK
ncbi:hypothetical protein HID58_087052, partial [Brassica napus]